MNPNPPTPQQDPLMPPTHSEPVQVDDVPFVPVPPHSAEVAAANVQQQTESSEPQQTVPPQDAVQQYEPVPQPSPTTEQPPKFDTSVEQPANEPALQQENQSTQHKPAVQRTKTRPRPNSTQNSLQIAEIRDGIVIMNDGSFRSVIMVKSINFDLMSPQEQEAVEYSYQSFLNSLYFPVQILIRSQKVDLTPYLERLDKIRSEHDNMLLALLMDDYISYITSLAQQTNIMDKNFYVVVPYFPHVDVQKALTQSKNFITGLSDLFSKREQHVVINEEDLEKAKTELRTRVQTVLSGLMQASIQGLPLDTQELIELYYDTYNPDTATRQQLKNFGQLNADVITKGKGFARQPQLDRELA